MCVYVCVCVYLAPHILCVSLHLASVPSSPRNVTAILNGATITVSWQSPEQLNGPVVSYSVTYLAYKNVCTNVINRLAVETHTKHL